MGRQCSPHTAPKLKWLFLPIVALLGSAAAASSDDLDRVDESIRLIGEMRSAIDRSQFDLEALLDQLDYDAATIVEFATDQIQFEQYPGLLRGPLGTLVSRAGNALDQSVFAARLLNDAGFDARIVRGTLSDEQAQALLQSLVREPHLPDVGDEKRLQKSLLGLRSLFASDTAGPGDEPPSRIEIRETTSRHERFLLETLRRAAIELTPRRDQSLVDETRDYFWIEYREGAGKWIQAHPAFPSDVAQPSNVAVKQHLADGVPEGLQQRIRIAAFVRRKFGDDVYVDPVMAPWERPAANTPNTLIRYMNFHEVPTVCGR